VPYENSWPEVMGISRIKMGMINSIMASLNMHFVIVPFGKVGIMML
jgi:hypothetical protein